MVVINEQTQYLVPGNSHTSRHAAVELLYAEKTGDWSAKDAAIRRLNWATYWVDADGKNQYPRDDNWLTDGYGDFVRHFIRAMASDPELAPGNQEHLLRTSSVIRSIEYGTSVDPLREVRRGLGGACSSWAPALRPESRAPRFHGTLPPTSCASTPTTAGWSSGWRADADCPQRGRAAGFLCFVIPVLLSAIGIGPPRLAVAPVLQRFLPDTILDNGSQDADPTHIGKFT